MSKVLLAIALILAVFSLQGCKIKGIGDGIGIEVSTPNKEIKTRCINGVNYYFFKEHSGNNRGWGFMAPKYNKDGKLSLCEG